MKRSLAAIQFIVLAKAALIGAQPVLTEENTAARLLGFSVEEKKFGTSSNDRVIELIERSGADQSWDITAMPLTAPASVTTYYSEPSDGMPRISDPRLAGANLVGISTTKDPTWTYQTTDETGLYLLGRVSLKDVNQDGRKDTLVTMYDPISTVFPFPLTMGTAWSDSSTQTLEFEGSPPVPVETVVSSHIVEGWGTLIAADGASPALRVRTDSRITTAGGQRSKTHLIRLVTPVPDGLMDESIYASGVEIRVDSLDAPISFAYAARSVYRPIRVENAHPVTGGFVLQPSYPNPFSTGTTIPFSIERSGPIRISVFDIQGRRTAELLDRVVTTGSHEISWNPGLLPSGVYRVVLQSGTAVVSRLVVLQK